VPFSSNAFDYYIGTVVGLLQPRRVCDIGPGAGKYAGIVRRAAEQQGFAAHLTAVEIDESYVAQYGLRSLYDEVIVADAVRLIDNPKSRFDLVIIGDCLEHMRKSYGIDLLNFLVYRSGYICVIYPEAYVQDDWDGTCRRGSYFYLGNGRFRRLEYAPSLVGRHASVSGEGLSAQPDDHNRLVSEARQTKTEGHRGCGYSAAVGMRCSGSEIPNWQQFTVAQGPPMASKRRSVRSFTRRLRASP
jgi:hypothetical protein